MFEKIYNSKIFGYIKLTYIFFLMIYCFGHHSPYTYRFFNATVFEILIIIFTICIVVPDLCNLKAYLKVKHFKWIIALLSCITISNLLNFRGGDIIGNARFYFWIFVYGLVIYPMFARKSKEENWNVLFLISLAYSILVFILSFLSMLSMYIPFPQMENPYYESNIYTIPFYANRFFGIYSDPNIGSLIGILAIGSTFILILNGKKETDCWKYLKWAFCGLNILIQISYIFCCDSRSGVLALLFSVFIGCTIWMTGSILKKGIKIIFRAVFVSLIVSAGVFFLGTSLKTTIQYIYALETSKTENKGSSNTAFEENGLKEETQAPKKQFGRADTAASSHIRLVMWQQAVKAIPEKLFFGGTARDTGKYLKKYATKETRNMMSGANLHNVYIYGLLTTGIFAIVFWIIFILIIAKDSFVYYYLRETNRMRKGIITVLIALFSAMHIVACFFNILYVVPGLITFLHWMFLGILAGITESEKAVPSCS